MNPLFRKDLRENFRLAVLAFAILTLIIVLEFHYSNELLHRVVLGQTSGQVDDLQPLLSGGFLRGITFFCAIFGAALGWFQTRSESHRDLWAFLVHRPVTRTQIFLGKTAAGLLLYGLGAGLPLLGMVGFAASPGGIAAPFELAMALPVLAIFLTGAAYYFAGMLTALRQARWFGSRIFGLGVAIVASLAVHGASAFWLALVLVLLLTGCVGAAAWGAYQSGGLYRGQPRFGKMALVLSLTFGSFFVMGLGVVLIEILFSGNNDYRWQYYRMTMDGRIYITTSHGGNQTITDLDGNPVLDPATGLPVKASGFNANLAPSLTASTPRKRQHWGLGNYLGNYVNATTFFSLWSVSDKTLWYMDRHGKLTGFNGVTRRHAGDIASGNDPFLRTGNWGENIFFNAFDMPSMVCTTSTVYRVDLDARKLLPLYTAPPGDPITSFEQNAYFNNVLVLSRSTIQVLNLKGTPLLSLPYVPDPVTYPQIEASNLRTSNSFAIWFHPDYERNSEADWKLPLHVVWISHDNQPYQTRDLPFLHTPTVESTVDKITTSVLPLPLQFIFSHNKPKADYWYCLIPSALCVVIGWSLVRRYHFTPGAAVGWLLFIFVLGIPALLAFLSAQEWPKRETCPACKKLRTVDRPTCEHCAAAFPPPDKTGIEIFEPLTAP